MGRPKGSKNKKTAVVTPQVTEPEPTIIEDDVAGTEKRRALEKDLPDPDFDFRELYHQGDTIYYVSLNYLTGNKELLELTVRTIYARSLVAWEEHGCARLIGYKSRDWIFTNRYEAEAYYKSIELEAVYGSHTD